MRSMYFSIAGGLAALAGAVLIWKYRDNLRPSKLMTNFNGVKSTVINGARSAYGSVAHAADVALHTERDVQQG